jgi:hypothetical protein
MTEKLATLGGEVLEDWAYDDSKAGNEVRIGGSLTSTTALG